MQIYNSLADLAELVPPPAPKTEKPAQTLCVYSCIGCRYVEAHGLVCDVCLRKILDDHAGRRKPTLIAACFEGRGCITLLRGQRAAYELIAEITRFRVSEAERKTP